MQIKVINHLEQLAAMKRAYIARATAPLDGMWLCGFVPQAVHYGFFEGDELAGYFCINDEAYLLQFYLDPQYYAQSSQCFEMVFSLQNFVSNTAPPQGAYVSTAEPEFLALCLDHFSSYSVNALMYQLDAEQLSVAKRGTLELIQAQMEPLQLHAAVAFAHASMGAPELWLQSYYGNLIARGELFFYRQQGELLALGECRGYDQYQTAYADLGVIVDSEARGRGLATSVLGQLVTISRQRGLIPICSTERKNYGAQKAIVRTGFWAPHRILQFH